MVTWLEDVTAKDLRTRSFELVVGERTVPGLLWTPPAGAPAGPLVLVGHGASGSKSQGYVVALARGLVRMAGMAVCAIDGPVHGQRRLDGVEGGPLPFLQFSQVWANDPTVTDAMVDDWRAVLEALSLLPEVDEHRVGYWGLSMGTILGLPLVAAEPRISAAVLGLMGLAGPTVERLRADARSVSCPIHFLVQWDDQLFPRDRAFELFDAFGTKDKVLVANPGEHGAVPDAAFKASAAFLIDRLGRAAHGVN
ncbi:MAG: dienelactone hydrolase family protein [Actinomycetota bacterium]